MQQCLQCLNQGRSISTERVGYWLSRVTVGKKEFESRHLSKSSILGTVATQWLSQSTDSHDQPKFPPNVYFLYIKDDFCILIWFGVLSCLGSDGVPQLSAIGSHFLLLAPSSAHPELQNQFFSFYFPKPSSSFYGKKPSNISLNFSYFPESKF